MKKFKLLYLLPIAAMIFAGCETKDKQNDSGNSNGDNSGDKKDSKQDFTGLSFENLTVSYDGQPHSISVSGELPTGALISYGDAGNTFTNAGTYEITAKITCDGYNDKEMTATLTINKLDFVGITFAGDEVEFDGQPHSIAPVIPAEYEGYQLSYGEAGNTFTGSGLHVVEATISKENYNDWHGTANLTIGAGPAATNPLKVIDFEDMTDNDLTDEIDLKFYNNGWTTPSAAKVAIEKNQVMGSGTNSMKMSITHQGSAFKATKDLTNKTYNKYTAFTIDTMMDTRVAGGKMKVQVQFWLKDLPLPDQYAGYRNTYITYTLSENAPSVWTHWEIPFDDASLSIQSGAISASYLPMLGVTPEDLTAYIDQVAVLVTPSYVEGGTGCYAYIDNIELTRGVDKICDKHIYGGSFVHIENEDVYEFVLADDLETGEFKLNNVSVSALEIEKSNSVVVAKDASTHGSNLTVTSRVEDDGTLTVINVVGTAATMYSGLQDMSFAKFANVNVDFTGVTTGSPLNDAHWYQENWTEAAGWSQVTNKMNVRGTNENPHCNMTTGYYQDYRYTYTYPEKFGLADKFSVDISNDFVSGSYDLKLKVKLVTTTGEVYVVGTADAYELIPANTAKWQHIEVNNFGELNVKAIVFVVKSTGGYNQYLYFDNLILTHSVPSALPPQPVHTIADGEYYIWNSSSDAFRLTVSDTHTTGSFTKTGTPDSYPVTITVNEESVTIKDTALNGAALTVAANIIEDNQMSVTSVSGTLGSAISASVNGKTIKQCANVNLDFADGTQDQYYQESHWKESDYSGSGWTEYAAPTNMRSKILSGNKNVNMHCSTGAKNFRYVPDLPIGPVNHLEVDLGNYWGSSAGDLRYKISLLNESDTVVKYVAGDGSNWATLAKNANQEYSHLTFDFDLVFARRLRITTSMGSGEAYLYMDNLQVNYKAPTPVNTVTAGYFYVWNSSSDAFLLQINEGMTTGNVKKLGGDTYNLTVEVDGDTVTFKDSEYSGSGLTITASIVANEQMQITGVTGLAASTFSASLLNKQVKRCTNGCNLGFSDGAGSDKYVNANWSEQKYTTGWVDVASPEMNSRYDSSSNKIVNLNCDGSTRNYIYTPDFPLGPINHISLRLGNYWTSAAGNISYKIAIIDGGGNKTYIRGDAGNFATIVRKNTAEDQGILDTSINEDFNLMVGYKIQITTKCSDGQAFLYVDDILTSYIAA